MLMSQRVIFSDNGTLTDLSQVLNDYRASTQVVAVVAAEDALYIGSDLPFNHKWIDVSSPNAVVSTLSVEIWWNGAWTAAVDVIDTTAVGGASLAQDGFVRWTTNDLKGWTPQQRSTDVTGLTGTTIYDFYWARFKWSANLTSTTALAFLGQKFASDAVLFSYYPDLNNTDLMAAFRAGKTDWNEQMIMATEAMVRELRRRDIIQSRSQIMDFEQLAEACSHKAAEIIFNGLGAPWAERRKSASDDFRTAFDVKYHDIDQNADGRLDPSERAIQTGWLKR